MLCRTNSDERLKRWYACAQSADTSTPTYNHSKAADKDCALCSSGHEEHTDWEVLLIQHGPLPPAAGPQRLASGDRVQAGAVGLRPAKVPVYAFFTPSATAQCARSTVLESLQSLAVRNRLQKPCLILVPDEDGSLEEQGMSPKLSESKCEQRRLSTRRAALRPRRCSVWHEGSCRTSSQTSTKIWQVWLQRHRVRKHEVPC